MKKNILVRMVFLTVVGMLFVPTLAKAQTATEAENESFRLMEKYSSVAEIRKYIPPEEKNESFRLMEKYSSVAEINYTPPEKE